MFKNLLEKFKKDRLPQVLVPQLMDQSARLPMNFIRGEGRKLWDVDGQCYLDARAGGGDTILGHSHAKVAEAISLQANKLMHIDNDFHIQEQAELAIRLCEISQQDSVFIGRFAHQAFHAASQLIRLYAADRGIKEPRIITNSLRPESSIQQLSVPINDIDALGKLALDEQVVAVRLQPMFDSTTLDFTEIDYLVAVRDLCKENGWLLVFDESEHTLARSGYWLAHQAAEILPDIVIFGRGLGNGLPISVCAAQESLTERLQSGDLTFELEGGPLICQVAIAVIDAIETEGLLAQASQNGEMLCRMVQQHIGTSPGILDIRSSGLMTLIEFEKAPANLQIACLESGLVIGFDYRRKIAILTPALALTNDEAKQIAEILQQVIAAV